MISNFHHHFFTSNILIVFLCEKFSLVIDSEIFQKSSPNLLQKVKIKGKILTKLHQISPNFLQKAKNKRKNSHQTSPNFTKFPPKRKNKRKNSHQTSPNFTKFTPKGKNKRKNSHQTSPNFTKFTPKGKNQRKNSHQTSPNFTKFPPKGKNKRKNSHQISPNFGRKGKTKGKILTKSQNMTKNYLYSNSSIIFLFFNDFTCFFILSREEKFFEIIMFIYTLNLNF